MEYLFSNRPRMNVYRYNGMRPLRALAIFVLGIGLGLWTWKAHQPAGAVSPPALVDCGR